MAQTGFTPIQLYYSSTTTNVPLAADLANGELAINITDGKLFYKDNAAAVQVIGWKTVPATAGGTGQTSFAVGDLLYANTTTTLAKLPDVATGNALISGGVGVAPSWGKIGLTTHVSGVLPVANGGTNASTASITSFNNITGYSASGATGTTTTNLVFSTSPTLVTPTLGAALATSIQFGSGSVLSSYETGTWTPVLQFGANTQSITVNLATYVKVGKSVTINMQITWAAKSGSGRVYITGLPFAKEGGGTIALLAGCPAGSVTTSAAIFYNVDGGGTVLNFAEQAGDIDSSSLAASGALFCSGTYFV
jgi:hypothetical protein